MTKMWVVQVGKEATASMKDLVWGENSFHPTCKKETLTSKVKQSSIEHSLPETLKISRLSIHHTEFIFLLSEQFLHSF